MHFLVINNKVSFVSSNKNSATQGTINTIVIADYLMLEHFEFWEFISNFSTLHYPKIVLLFQL